MFSIDKQWGLILQSFVMFNSNELFTRIYICFYIVDSVKYNQLRYIYIYMDIFKQANLTIYQLNFFLLLSIEQKS